jgi:hypothetical protein
MRRLIVSVVFALIAVVVSIAPVLADGIGPTP